MTDQVTEARPSPVETGNTESKGSTAAPEKQKILDRAKDLGRRLKEKAFGNKPEEVLKELSTEPLSKTEATKPADETSTPKDSQEKNSDRPFMTDEEWAKYREGLKGEPGFLRKAWNRRQAQPKPQHSISKSDESTTSSGNQVANEAAQKTTPTTETPTTPEQASVTPATSTAEGQKPNEQPNTTDEVVSQNESETEAEMRELTDDEKKVEQGVGLASELAKYMDITSKEGQETLQRLIRNPESKEQIMESAKQIHEAKEKGGVEAAQQVVKDAQGEVEKQIADADAKGDKAEVSRLRGILKILGLLLLGIAGGAVAAAVVTGVGTPLVAAAAGTMMNK